MSQIGSHLTSGKRPSSLCASALFVLKRPLAFSSLFLPSHSFLFSLSLGCSFFFSLVFFPLFTFAGSANDLLDTAGALISSAAPVMVGLGVLFFLWGVALYILSAADEAKKAQGRNIMIWGVIALFVMVSVWGLVRLLQNTLGIKSDSAPPIPRVSGV